ncbi:MAG: hypothetical protein QOI63_576 [Thermoplasmata archaeon]|nr:hypothetical protein [Thermoplasmata archaeon]
MDDPELPPRERPKDALGYLARYGNAAALVGVLALQGVLGAYLFHHDANWFIAPDDYQGYWYTSAVQDHGLPTLHERVPTDSPYHPVRPRGSILVDGESTIYQGLATFYLYLPFLLLGFKSIFLAPAFYGMVSTVFVYLIAGRLSRGPAPGIAAVLYGASAPLLFWSNFLFSNTAAMAVLLAAVYVSLLPLRTWRTTLAVALFVLAGLVRAEFWVLSVLYLGAYGLVHWRRLGPRGIALAVAAGAVATVAVFALNHSVYGNLDLFASLGSQEQGSAGVSLDEEYNPASALLGNFQVPRIATTYATYAAATSLAFVLGPLAFLALGRGPPLARWRAFAAGLGAGCLFILVVFGGKGFNTGGADPISSSYVRYFLPVLAFLAVVAAVALSRQALRRPLLGAALVVLAVLPVTAAGLGVLMDPVAGLPHVEERALGYRNLDESARTLPPEAVVVGDLPGRIIAARPVLSPQFLPKETRANETLRLSRLLEGQGHPVYLARGWSLADTSGNHFAWFRNAGAALTLDPTGRFYRASFNGTAG